MRNRSLIFLVVLVIVNCSGDNGGGNSVSLRALTVSGSRIDLDGVYKSPCEFSSNLSAYQQFTLSYSSTSSKLAAHAFGTNDTNCSGASQLVGSAEFRVEDSGTTIITSGWVDSNGTSSTAPMAGNGLGTLSDNIETSVFNITVTVAGLIYSSGQNFQEFIVVDDTGAKPVLHFSYDYPSSTSAKSDRYYARQ